MDFTSWPFFVLVIIVFILYYLPLTARYQTHILLLSSTAFYAYGQLQLVPLLVVTVITTYGILYAAMRVNTATRVLLALGVTLNIAILALFKYKFLFIGPQTMPKSGIVFIDQILFLPLPIGISFFVFHNISMLVDFTKMKSKVPVPSWKDASLYIIFFPQLVSGPITRAQSFFPQIQPKRFADLDVISAGKWITLGYFSKLFCANNLAQFTNYMNPPHFETLRGLDRALLLFLYSLQIYSDFFGYSAIAVGLAILFGYRLPINFNHPYTSPSFAVFWTRWHISLSTWLKNYLYIPLGGNRHGASRTYLNLFLVMLLGGLWHGAGYCYILWGGLHGLMLMLERPFLASEQRLLNRCSGLSRASYVTARTLLVFVMTSFAWLFFKLPRFQDALAYLNASPHGTVVRFPADFYWLACLYASPIIFQHLFGFVADKKAFVRIEPYFYALLLLLAIMEAGPETPFIYFQF